MTAGRRERAVTLMEITFILPIVAAGLAVTFQITSRAVQLQRRTLADLRDDARQEDLLRRIGEDAAGARTAKLERGESIADSTDDGQQVAVLRFEGCSPTTLPADDAEAATVAPDVTICYRVAANHVTRTETLGATAASYEWSIRAGWIWTSSPSQVSRAWSGFPSSGTGSDSRALNWCAHSRQRRASERRNIHDCGQT